MTDPQTLASGRYLLVKRLGEGGMATVYRGYDQRLQVWRAIKVLLPEYAKKKKIMARFEAEAQTMALLEHPNIVRVYDVDRDDDWAYIVMELVEGGSLVDWLETHGPMPPRLAVDVIVETCQGLQVAHNKGVIHRDLKPHNIMVDRDGVCRLTDFGIARAGDSDVNLTKTGAVMGTWGFMAPEQRSDAKHVDERADVYAMAATLYSLLTDKTPMDLFAAEQDATMLEGVPSPLVPVLIKATEYKKEKRYASASEFAAALLGVRDALPEVPAGTPKLQRPVEDLPPPPPTTSSEVTGSQKAIASVPAAKAPGGGETLLPDDGLATVSHTMPPMEGDLIEDSGQHRAVYAPSGGRTVAPPDSLGRSGGTSSVAILGGVAVLLLLAAGGTLWALLSRDTGATAGSEAPTPVEVAEAPAVVAEAPAATAAATTAAVETPAAPAAKRPAATKSTPARTEPTRTEPARTEPASGGSAEAPAEAPATAAPAVQEAPPPPPPPSQCFKDVDVASSVSKGASLAVAAKTCVKTDVTLHYRSAGGGSWFTKKLSFVLGGYRAVIDVDDTFAEGVEYYLSADGVTYGSAGRPKKVKVN
ncbi:MAG: serine/threonine protein kinase [Alphaproteobacteria bacterium]|nr:serine/threonine protein kinase [Alphaproteobacteria bacterium]